MVDKRRMPWLIWGFVGRRHNAIDKSERQIDNGKHRDGELDTSAVWR